MVELIESAAGALAQTYSTELELKWTGEWRELLVRIENNHADNALQYRVFGGIDAAFNYRTELLFGAATDINVAAGANDTQTIQDPWPYIRIQLRGVGGASSHITHVAGR